MYVWFLPDAEGKPQLEQANNYYPFGMAYTKNAADSEEESFARENKYKYNGKEEQPMPGKWLDYGARFYDAQIARFHSVDPLAHSFSSQSPYVYAGNNPILNIDFMGLSAMSNVSNKRTSSFTFGMTDEDFIKATRPIGLEGIESKEKTKKTDKNTESQTSQQNRNGKKKDGKGNVAVEDNNQQKLLEDIATALGFSLGGIEEGMKFMLVTELELRNAFIEQGYSTKKIDGIINKSATTGGIARIGGRILFWGQAGYNVHNMIMVDRSFENVALGSVDTFFSGIATYGGLKGMAIAGTYYLGKESIIMTMKGLEQGLIRTNTNMMRNYIPGLGPSPVIWNW